MIVGLDHIAVEAKDLEAGASAFQALLGRPAERRDGEAWFQLSNMALRLVAGERDAIQGLAFGVESLDEAQRLVERRGLALTDGAFD
ncbi:MAG TPA: hypothetical protein VIO94_01820, partial [Phenylobacterium sp.]